MSVCESTTSLPLWKISKHHSMLEGMQRVAFGILIAIWRKPCGTTRRVSSGAWASGHRVDDFRPVLLELHRAACHHSERRTTTGSALAACRAAANAAVSDTRAKKIATTA